MDGVLRVFNRADLVVPEDLAEKPDVEFYVAMLPEDEGGLVELVETDKNQEGVIYAYTTLRNLLTACGGGQPYKIQTAAQLDQVADNTDGYALLVAIDVWHPEGHRYPEPDWREFAPLDFMSDRLPDEALLYIPTRPAKPGDQRYYPELYGTRPGEALLLAWSTPEMGWQACGPNQFLAAVHADRLEAIAHQVGATGVVVNEAVLDLNVRHQEPVVDWVRETREELLTGERTRS